MITESLDTGLVDVTIRRGRTSEAARLRVHKELGKLGQKLLRLCKQRADAKARYEKQAAAAKAAPAAAEGRAAGDSVGSADAHWWQFCVCQRQKKNMREQSDDQSSI